MSLDEIKADFIVNVKKYLDDNLENESKKFMKSLKECFKELRDYQTSNLPIPVGAVYICFMNTSFYFNEPIIRVYCFSTDNVWKEPVFTKDLDARWLVNPLESYKSDLMKLHKAQELVREEINVEMRKMLKLYLGLSVHYLKYGIRECCLDDSVKKIYKSNPFCVSFGEYMDWQQPVYCEKEDIDLMQAEEDDELRFSTYRDSVYRGMEINSRDLSNVIFINCVFERCTFTNSILNDTLFINCRIKDTSFDGGTMFGTAFNDCLFTSVTAENIRLIQNEEDAIKNGLYKGITFNNCEEQGNGLLFSNCQ